MSELHMKIVHLGIHLKDFITKIALLLPTCVFMNLFNVIWKYRASRESLIT